ncbi:MAG: chemotaxis protein [Rhodospirillaceae bacterium]
MDGTNQNKASGSCGRRLQERQDQARSYLDSRIGARVISVVVGDCVVSGESDVVITTTLGSCVATCLYDPEAGLGGMNHFLLADSADDRLSASARYGSAAMEQLINRMLSRTGRRDRLRAKIFGGGAINGFNSTIGHNNVEFVMSYLAFEGIPTISWDVGGTQARVVRFFPVGGRSQRRLLGSAGTSDVMQSEASFAEKLRTTRIEGEIELF